VVSLWVVNASPIILLAKVGLVDLLRQQKEMAAALKKMPTE
jgi:hypothetical protein